MHIRNAIVRQENREDMHIIALLLKIISKQHKGTNGIFCISLEWLNNAVFGKK